MRADGKLLLFLVCYGVLLLLPTPWLALQESTEGRYGEIAREMLVSGNFLEPTLNGIAHFHKPPLPYWAMVSGMKLFGVNGFGVRFFGVLAALAALYWLYRLAQLLLDDDQQAFTAMLVMASSFLFLIVSRTVSTDIYLTCFVVGAQYQLFRQIYGEKSRGNVCRYALLLGLGFLTKGPVIFLFTVLPALGAGLFDKRHRHPWGFRDGLLGVGIFLLVALPWYLAVVREHPALLDYFLNTQTVDRLATDRFHRSKPVWFYFALFPATLFPAIVPLIRSWVSARSRWLGQGALVWYVVVPFTVFCLSRSKMGPYILPLHGVAALLAVRCYFACKAPMDRRIAVAAMLLLVPLLACAGFLYAPLAPLQPYLLVLALATALASHVLIRQVNRDTILATVSLVLIALNGAGYFLVPSLEPTMKGYRNLVASINARDPQRRSQVVVYRDFLPSVSFYRDSLAIMALGKEREVQFQDNAAYRAWYVTTDRELVQRLQNQSQVFLVARPRDVSRFQSVTGRGCRELLDQRKFHSYECSFLMQAL